MHSLLEKKLTINEIFYSIQGESYLSGLPCVFVRLTGCHQRCTYCDTEYAFYEGQKKTIADIFQTLSQYDCRNVLITGGEPLLQSNCGYLCEFLLKNDYRVAIETSGNLCVTKVPREVIKIMDLKTPSSGESEKNNYNNLQWLEEKDEVKFVVMNEADMKWALEQIKQHKLTQRCKVSCSPTNFSLLPQMAQVILDSGLPIRLQVQFHKLIWPKKERGF